MTRKAIAERLREIDCYDTIIIDSLENLIDYKQLQKRLQAWDNYTEGLISLKEFNDSFQ